MAQGRGNAHPAALLLFIVASHCSFCSLWHLASAATYTVGDSKGWDLGIDYTSWAAGYTFKVGDVLFFPYLQEQHNVVVVDKAGYDACSDSKATATFSAGNTNITLSTTGAHYYLCSIIGHCATGMKLAVTISATAAPPTASPPVSTAPTPSKTPSSPPMTPPSTAPPSTSTPSTPPSTAPSSTSTPTPTPSSASSSSPAPAPVPASTPTPSSSPTPTPSAVPSPSAPGSTPSSAASPPSPPPPPNAAPSLLASASMAPLLALWAVLFV